MPKRKTPFVCGKCGSPDKESHAGLCISCYNKKHYAEHREERIKAASEWAKNNPEKAKASARKSARKRWANLSQEEKLEISRKTESHRSEEEKARRRIRSKKWYHENKERIKNKPTYKIPCVTCGKNDPKARYVSGKCNSCYKKESWARLHPRQEKFCECGKRLGPKTKLHKCQNCRNKERYKNDPEYRKHILSQNIKNNKQEHRREKARLCVIRRRSRLAKVECTLTPIEWKEILEKYNHRCAYCGGTGKLEKDHVIPISKGGPTTKENIVPACRSCNSSKCNRVGEFAPKIFDPL